MPISQAISPATGGDQLVVGGAVVSKDSTTLVSPDGVSHPATARAYVTRTPVEQPYLGLSLVRCPDTAIYSTLGGSPCIPVGAAIQASISEPTVWNYDSLVGTVGADYAKVSGLIVDVIIKRPSVNIPVCYSSLNGVVPSRLGVDVSLTQMAGFSGVTDLLIGDVGSIIQQFVEPVTAEYSVVTGIKLASLGKVENILAQEECVGYPAYSGMPRQYLSQIFGIYGRDASSIGTPEVFNYTREVPLEGATLSVVPRVTFIAHREGLIHAYLYDDSCAPAGSAIQTSMGLAKGFIFAGVSPLGIGGWGFTQGPPKVLLSANDQLTVGDWSYLLPDPTNFHASFVTPGPIGQHKVKNQREVIHFSGADYSLFYAPVITRRDPPQPLGRDHSEYGTLFISHWRRFPGPVTAGDTLRTPDYHWVSSSPRYISPDSDVLGGVGQGLVEERIFSAGSQDAYGISFVYNLNQFAGPMGVGTVSEYTNGHTIEYGTRYLSDFQILSHDYGQAYIQNKSTFVSPYVGVLDTFLGGVASIHNANVPVFPVPYYATEIPYTHLVHRNPYQQLHQGHEYSQFGAMYLELSIRRVYPGVVSNSEVFNPGMRVTREIVIAPVGNQFDAYGLVDIFLLDLAYQMNQYESFEPGLADIGYLNRHKQMYGENFLEIPRPFVKNAAEFITPGGQDHFVQPYQTTYIEEHFSLIGPSIVTSTNYGTTYVHNLNQEPEIGGGDLSEISIRNKVELFIRRVIVQGVSTEFGDSYVHDSRQDIVFQNPTNHTFYGNHYIYLGQPWLPSNQNIRPPSIRRHSLVGSQDELDSYWTGNLTATTNPQEAFIAGDTYTLSGAFSVVNTGVSFPLQGPSTVVGSFIIVGGQGVPVVFSGTDDQADPGYSLIGVPTVRPNWVYMTQPPTPNPYPGTQGWYAPDSTFANPIERRVKIGNIFISNFNRELFIGGQTQERVSDYTEVSTQVTHSIGMHGVTSFASPLFMVLGGVRTVTFDYPNQGSDTSNYGVTHVGRPSGPHLESVTFNGIGVDSFDAGTAKVENFIRYYSFPSIGGSTLPGTAWVSHSPREYTPDSVTTQTEYGYAWVSFLVRELPFTGVDTSIVKTYSNDRYNDRMRAHHTAAVDVVRVHPYDTDISEVGEPYIKRGGACE